MSSAASLEHREAARSLLETARRIVLYRNVLEKPPVDRLLAWADTIVEKRDSAESARAEFFAAVTRAQVDPQTLPVVPGFSFWQSFVLHAVLFDTNPFTLMAETRGDELPQGLVELAASDLRALQALYKAPHVFQSLLDPQGVLDNLEPRYNAVTDPLQLTRQEMAAWLGAQSDWGAGVITMARWVKRVGAGEFGRFLAFRWITGNPLANGRLRPILRPDLINPDALVGYESEREQVFRNTEKFVKGLPAQNVLLYGDRGTGKSATVKAALYRYAPQGLRMVEVPHTALGDIPDILQMLATRACRFILFIDDLSFDEADAAYKELKAVLEGTLEGRPRNVLVYATSNRRHLIQQRFSDREGSADDVNPRDTQQEKLSLSDRFGLTVIFPSPDQERFLEIVRGLAKQRGLLTSGKELEKKALQWAVWHNGRSPRSAQQFVDYLAGEEALGDDTP